MDLVEEENRALRVRAEPLARAREDLADVRDGRRDGRKLLERRAGHARDDARERRLAASGRPVEDERADAVLLDREAQRRALGKHVALTDEFGERRRAHA